MVFSVRIHLSHTSGGGPCHTDRGPLWFESGFYFRGNKKVMRFERPGWCQHIIGQSRSYPVGETVKFGHTPGVGKYLNYMVPAPKKNVAPEPHF